MRKSLSTKPQVVDLFAGAGMFSAAFATSGFDVIYAAELERPAVETYRRNVGSEIELIDVRKAAMPRHCDVLIGGPPCQGFSTLGKRDQNDPRNLLSLEVVRWARALNPSVVVIENVAAYTDSPISTRVVRALRRLGYELTQTVLNAFDYGVPQTRLRSFTVATRTGKQFVAPRRYRSCTTVKDAWTGLPSRPNGKNFHIAPKPTELAAARMRLIPPGGGKRDVMDRAPELTPPSWWRLNTQVTDAWGRMSWDAPSNTLRTCFLNPSKGRYIHPTQNRVISIREAARLHTIPDEWEFYGTPYQVARQIGNSVPIKLGQAVARTTLRCL